MTKYVTVIRNEPSPYYEGWFQTWAVDTSGREVCIGQSPEPNPIGQTIQL